ncbi:MAG: AAA family ATPase [Proteobacteria bacterium]|nr:AAA family ATPase [Pseudomonadota bacterium]
MDVLPELGLLLGEQPDVPALGTLEEKNRFELVFSRFLQAAPSDERPMLLFLDDLQWIDNASLELLSAWLPAPGTGNVLLLGAYRSNEVDADHPLNAMLASLTERGVPQTSLELGPLASTAVHSLIQDTVGSGSAKLDSLLSLVMDKTGANPFFVRSFLSEMHEDGLLTFDPDGGAWTWDSRSIAAKDYTDNVIDHVVGRIGRMSEAVQEALSIGAALGARFGIEAAAKALGRPDDEVAHDLWPAAESGFLDPLSDALGVSDLLDASMTSRAAASFRFVHDRVQEAAYSRLPADRRAELHLSLGRLLLAETPEHRLEDELFSIVGHFERAGELVSDPEEQMVLAGLLMRAARRAQLMSLASSVRP